MILRKTSLLVAFVLLLPSVVADCVFCSNDPTNGMISRSRGCTAERVAKGNKCIDNEIWIRDGYCQLSCFEAGRGYEGLVCCPSPSVPTASPVAPPTGGQGDAGEWGDVFDMTLIPIHTLLLPDGQVLSYGTNDKGDQGGDLFYEVWDRSNGVHHGHKLLEQRTETDVFCSSLNVDTSTGNVMIMGGDGRNIGNQGGGIKNVLEYLVDTEEVRFHPKGNMTYARWYGTSVNLPNGDIFVVGGRDEEFLGSDIPELWSPDTGFRPLPGASVPAIANNREKNYWYYPHTYVNADGILFVIMPRKGEEVYVVNTEGQGSIEQIGRRPFTAHPRTGSLMFNVNKVAFLDDEGNIWEVDISSSSSVTWTWKNNLGHARVNGSMAMLPDGRVAIVGGADNTDASRGTVEDAVLEIQIWDPAANTITNGPEQRIPRLYHSSAIVLVDGCVMSAGGGSPGPLTNLNGQLYCPYYGYDRPIITCPKNVASGKTFTMIVDSTSEIVKVTATKAGSSTHTRNCDTRWLELKFDVVDDTTLRVYVRNKNVMIGGVWMFNVINEFGVPSEASIVGVNMAAL